MQKLDVVLMERNDREREYDVEYFVKLKNENVELYEKQIQNIKCPICKCDNINCIIEEGERPHFTTTHMKHDENCDYYGAKYSETEAQTYIKNYAKNVLKDLDLLTRGKIPVGDKSVTRRRLSRDLTESDYGLVTYYYGVMDVECHGQNEKGIMNYRFYNEENKVNVGMGSRTYMHLSESTKDALNSEGKIAVAFCTVMKTHKKFKNAFISHSKYITATIHKN